MTTVDTALCHPGLLGRVLGCVKAYTTPSTDLAALSREELRHIAGDLALAESVLLSLSAGARDNTALMERMMRARGLDPDKIRHTSNMALRDAEIACSQCRNTGRCRRELDAGTAAADCHEYCPNAATFDDLAECAAAPAFP
ncbi:MAG TPA: DUF6455 family protein [Acetobacteraceae bacterium]|jgi:hypothetical protein